MANKINEIIEVLNGSETVEGLTTRVDNLDDRVFDNESDIQILEDRVDDIENTDWVLCDDVSSVHQHVNPYYNFTKDVKIVFNLYYDYQRPNDSNVSSGRVIYTVYFKKGDMYYNRDKIIPVLNGEWYPDDGYRNTVYFGITFDTLFYDSPNDIVYHAYTEYVDLNDTVSKHHDTFTLHRQNENLNYNSDSFANVYIKDGE